MLCYIMLEGGGGGELLENRIDFVCRFLLFWGTGVVAFEERLN